MYIPCIFQYLIHVATQKIEFSQHFSICCYMYEYLIPDAGSVKLIYFYRFKIIYQTKINNTARLTQLIIYQKGPKKQYLQVFSKFIAAGTLYEKGNNSFSFQCTGERSSENTISNQHLATSTCTCSYWKFLVQYSCILLNLSLWQCQT